MNFKEPGRFFDTLWINQWCIRKRSRSRQGTAGYYFSYLGNFDNSYGEVFLCPTHGLTIIYYFMPPVAVVNAPVLMNYLFFTFFFYVLPHFFK